MLRRNISKSNYMLIDNCINASTKKHFEIKLQQNVLNRVRNVKYLGMLTDDGLNWDPIFCSLSLLIVVADGPVLAICHNLLHRLTSWRTNVILIVCHN